MENGFEPSEVTIPLPISPIQKPDLIKVCGRGGFSMKTLMVLALVGIALGADAPPPMKDGLWKVDGTIVGGPPNTKRLPSLSLCVKRGNRDQTPLPTPGGPPPGAECKIVSRTLNQKGMRLETACVVNGQPIRMRQTVAILSDTELTQTTEFTGSTAKNTTVLSMKYVGACPAGMASGDIMSSAGKITHPPGR
jgi:hypothetical protein